MRNVPHIKYLLFGLVAIIWGLIIFRVLHAMNSDEPIPPTSISHRPVIKLDDDSAYNLINVVYPDPFFKNLQSEEAKVTEEMSLTAKISDSVDTEIAAVRESDSPSIKYSGYIFNPITKKKTAIISIDGNTKSVGLNESIDDKIRITFISNQKIGILYKGRRIEYFIGG